MDTRRQKHRRPVSKAEKNTLQEACAKLRISIRTGLRWIKIGKVIALRPGHRYLITENELERLLTDGHGNETNARKQNP